MSTINLIFYKTPYDDQIIKSLTGELLSSDDYKFSVSYDPKDVISKLPTLENGILLFYINDKYDLQEALVVLKTIKKFSHAKFFKFFCVLTHDYNRSEKILKQLGCLGFFTPAEKSSRVAKRVEQLRLKMLPFLKPVSQEEVSLDAHTSIIGKENASTPVEEITFLSSLELSCDTWLLKSKSDCNLRDSNWTIDVYGPSPHIGKWIEQKNNNHNSCWKFIFKNADDEDCFMKVGSHWYFEGQRPIYDWGRKSWRFVAPEPHLYLVNVDGEKFSRLFFKKSMLYITKNSDFALAKEDLIRASGEIKLNAINFEQLKAHYASNLVIGEFTLESGEISVDLEYVPNHSNFNLSCDLEDIHEKELILLSPHNAITLHSNVKAQVVLKYDGKEADVLCHGKVLEIESLENQDSLTIGVEDMSSDKLKAFLDLYGQRQANITDFMTRARGF